MPKALLSFCIYCQKTKSTARYSRSRSDLFAGAKTPLEKNCGQTKESRISAKSPEEPFSFCIHFPARAYIGDTIRPIAKRFMRAQKLLSAKTPSKQKRAELSRIAKKPLSFCESFQIHPRRQGHPKPLPGSDETPVFFHTSSNLRFSAAASHPPPEIPQS